MGEIVYGEAIHIREQAKVDAARITQKSGNELRAARTALENFQASLSNKRAMDSAGKNIGTITENLARTLDAATTGAFETRIAAAEQAGSVAAMAAAAGIGGSSLEMYNETAQLALDRATEQQERSLHSQNWAMSEQRGDVLSGAISGLDNNIYRADIDYTALVDHHKMGLFDRLSTLGMAAAATAFGGPQAGMAVVGMAEAGQQAANGDFASASSSLMGSLRNAAGGAKDWQRTGGSYWGAARQKAEAPKEGRDTIVVPRASYGSTLLK